MAAHEEKEHDDHLAAIRDVKEAWDLELFPCQRSFSDADSSSSFPDGASEWKRVHFVRHGQGTHNKLAETLGDAAYLDESVNDARLTEKGRQEAADNSQKTASMNLEIVYVSPLSRATETGVLAFQEAAAKDVPFVAHESLREQMGKHVCDRRRNVEELKNDFPMIDYSLIETAEDVLWTQERESKASVAKRAWVFINYILSRPEKEIAAVCHSSFLLTLFNVVLSSDDKSLQHWFKTGEIRSVYIRASRD